MPETYVVQFRNADKKYKSARVEADSQPHAREIAIPPEGYKFHQASPLSKLARHWAKSNKGVRDRMLAAYGGKCQCPSGCPESIPEFLNLDHIRNNGTAERSKFGAGSRFYRWLERQGWPKDDYRLLCYNCNMARAKQKDKCCPHERLARTRRVRAIPN